MISKEKLLNSWVDSSDGELLNLYVEAANSYGIEFSEFSGVYDKFIECTPAGSEGLKLYGLCDENDVETISKQLTLADFKPKTKVEYVKCEFKAGWEAVKEFETNDPLVIKVMGSYIPTVNVEQVYDNYDSLYRKVETEITWKDDVRQMFGNRDDSFCFQDCNIRINVLAHEDTFIEMCHIVSNANK